MLYITLYLLYVLFLLFLSGSLTRKLFEKLTLFSHSASPPDLANTLLFGIISLTTLVSFISLIAPITLLTHFCILGFLLLYAYYDKKNVGDTIKALFFDFKANPYLYILGCICLFPAIIIASGPVGYHDTGMYHAQAVKWINEYGTVYGLGNLHYRLAFNSSWFYLAAFFDILSFDGRTSHVINLVPYTLLLFICFSGFYGVFKGNLSIANILKCFFAFPFCANRFLTIVLLPSLSPDLVVSVLILYVLVLSVDYIEQRATANNSLDDSQRQTYTLILCASFFLPTIKLSSLPILLFPLFLLTKTENRTRALVSKSFLVGIVILLPFLTGNVLLSGYLLFPFPQIDLLSFDWKVPYQVAENVRRSIKYFAINPMGGDGIWSVAGMSTLEWIQLWFARSGGKLINPWTITAFISAVVFLIVCFVRRSTLYLNILGIHAIVLCGIVFWFFSAPAYRFGVGWIWAFIILALGSLSYLMVKSLRPEFSCFLYRGLLIVICALLINLLVNRWDSFELVFDDPARVLWAVRDLPEAKMKAVEIRQKFIIYVPLKERAWNGALPSSPYVNYSLHMRGSSLKDGFRVTK